MEESCANGSHSCINWTAGKCCGHVYRNHGVSQINGISFKRTGKKVEKHNTVIERTYKLEEAQAVMQEQIKVANHRIGDLEKEREE